jgi:SPP1 gp7 family putative phage head morphogenesis protein
MRRRFDELTKIIKVAVLDKDVLGLEKHISVFQMFAPGEGAFAFTRSAAKVEGFMRWLRQQVESGILTLAQYQQIGKAVEGAWMNTYILDSYKRGVLRARAEMKAIGMAIPSIEESGGINAVMSLPFHVDRVGLIYTRVYAGLQGITAQMDLIISQILAQGLIDGDGPRLLARKMVAAINGAGLGDLGITDKLGRFIPAKIRAEILARTEVIRAHHLATIQEYRNWGLLGITVKGEWKTAGDKRVCDKCEALEGKIFTLDEIEPMIPLHPQCRCIALPYIEENAKDVNL